MDIFHINLNQWLSLFCILQHSASVFLPVSSRLLAVSFHTVWICGKGAAWWRWWWCKEIWEVRGRADLDPSDASTRRNTPDGFPARSCVWKKHVCSRWVCPAYLCMRSGWCSFWEKVQRKPQVNESDISRSLTSQASPGARSFLIWWDESGVLNQWNTREAPGQSWETITPCKFITFCLSQ